ncbi:glycosyltransferase family 4 protein [Deinococcus budaensis]|uniref:Glycosyltransferase involved in cell wall biosynthesis n=1 Tax=Deinococcus budaensis TaxID=1665626 RepID=A0A7W8GED1_9DEIO|nr:glycosyltransferase family 4 protein [Deinococcus budaensis]MBB5234092.1 glycosyltransferase involved in cell wall biosynthesis [Deinococcus budaensis]
MNVLVVHNYYQQAGGEDAVFHAETEALRARGVNVRLHTVHNDSIGGQNPVGTALGTVWNARSARALAAVAREHRAEVVHFHNTFPLVSPAAYRAAQSAGAAVVQTLHNFRLLCANALLFRDGHVCEACVGRTPPSPAVQHACYRGSRAGSAVVATMLTTHRLLGTYERQVDLYIALSEFSRQKLIQGGLPADRLVVKPNFLSGEAARLAEAAAPGTADGAGAGAYALFVGRLSPEKGTATLLRAWERLGQRLPLRIVGDGPLAPQVAEAAQRQGGVEWLGRQPPARVLELMRGAALLAFPSECYENFPMTLVEAFASGLPVVASDLGAMPGIVEHGHTGRLFRPGDPADLAAQVEWLLAHPAEHAAMRRAARREYETHYTEERNVELLLGLYRQARARRQARPTLATGRVPG